MIDWNTAHSCELKEQNPFSIVLLRRSDCFSSFPVRVVSNSNPLCSSGSERRDASGTSEADQTNRKFEIMQEIFSRAPKPTGGFEDELEGNKIALKRRKTRHCLRRKEKALKRHLASLVVFLVALVLLHEKHSTKQLSMALDRSRDGVVPIFLTRRPSWNLKHGWWKSEWQCRLYTKQIREFWKRNEKAICGPDKSCSTMVHTELMQRRNRRIVIDVRRQQLLILSFLATQHTSVKMNILANDQEYSNPPEWLAYLLRHPVYSERLQITNFDFERLENLPQKRLLSKAYHNVDILAHKSDLRRYAVLYQYVEKLVQVEDHRSERNLTLCCFCNCLKILALEVSGSIWTT